MLTVGSLFSGIGGFDLGLEWADMRVVWQSEIDPYASAVLRKHWPDVPNHGDVRSIRAGSVERVDVICGGFPCQPFSSAARGANTMDAYLWPEMLRVVQELRPPWVCGENVAAINRVALEQVVADLEACGYETAPPLVIPACAVGCDHRRDRYWFIGHADSNCEPERAEHAETRRLSRASNKPGVVGGADGLPHRVDRLRCLGNAVVPQIAEIIGRAIVSAAATNRSTVGGSER